MASTEKPNPVDEHVGRRAAERRNALALGVVAASKAVGVMLGELVSMEMGRIRIGAVTLYQMSVAYGWPVGKFFEGLGDPDVTGEPSRAMLSQSQL